MADPLSIAGSAVGIISLGIQVFQGLYDYIGSVQSRDKDLATASEHIKNLIGIFQALNDLVAKFQQLPNPNSKAIHSLQKCVQDSKQGIEELRVLLESLQNAPANNMKAKLKNAGKLLAFGVRREDLLRMQDKVLALTTTSDFALQVINSDLGISHTKEIAKLGLLVDSRFSSTNQILHALGQKTDGYGMQLQITTNTVQTGSDSILAAVSLAKRDIIGSTDIITAQMQALQSLVISQHQQTQDQLATLETSQRYLSENGRQLLQKPAAFRNVCDAVGYSHLEPARKSQIRRQDLSSSPCSCDIRRSKTATRVKRHYLWRHLSVYNQQRESSKHRPGCRFSRPQQSQDIGVQFRLTLCPALSFLMEMSLMCTTGAGGYSISPQLRCRQGRKPGNPASMTILRLVRSLRDLDKVNDMRFWESRTAQTEQGLLKLFQDNEASPYDRGFSGGSLLHDIFSLLTLNVRIEPDMESHILPCLLRIVKTLVGVGVLCDDINTTGSDCLEHLTALHLTHCGGLSTRRMARAVGAYIAQIYDTVPHFNPAACDAFGWVAILIENTDLVNELDLPPLMTAIALRLETTVKSILSGSRQAIFERYYGMTVLHLASSWPTGLSLLLSAGAIELLDETTEQFNYGDVRGARALDLAIFFNCEESCHILLSHGAHWDHFPHSISQITHHPSCVRCLAEHLADRRKKLRDIALSALSPRTLAQLGVDSRSSPDGRASLITKELLEAGVYVPSALTVSDKYKGVYIDGNLDIEHFRIFYDAGFREISTHHIQSVLKLASAKFGSIFETGPGDLDQWTLSNETMLWLEHTFRPDQPVSDFDGAFEPKINTSVTTWHYLALKSANNIGPTGPAMGLQAPFCRFFDKIFASLCRDSCSCLCSSGGCLPFTIWLKQPSLWSLSAPFGHQIQATNDWSMWTQVSTELLTFLTFEALGMTHTCFYSTYVGFKNEDTLHKMILERGDNGSEIMEEEQELGLRLGQLVREFCSQLQNTHQPLDEFVYGYWSERMAEECVPSLEETEQLRQLGIKVDDYETPHSLRKLLGVDFDFEDYVEHEYGHRQRGN